VAQTPPAPPAAPGAPVVQQERRVIIQRGPGGSDRMQGPGRRGGQRLLMRAGGPENRAERLTTLLQLTPAQQPALKAYLDATAPPAMPAMAQPTSNTPPTAVERADRMAEMAGKMAAEAKKHADATRAFYAALTPSQRKVFDTAPVGGGRMIQIRQMRRGPGMPDMPGMPPMPPGPPGRAG
jgi:periplasmic protein CpxP/Spy